MKRNDFGLTHKEEMERRKNARKNWKCTFPVLNTRHDDMIHHIRETTHNFKGELRR